MRQKRKISRGILIAAVSLACVATAFAETPQVFKRYPVESGMIYYDINITGASKGFSTRTRGIARLVFDQWGARELKEEDSTETQTGDFNETRDIHTLTKMDHGTIYTVDFDEQTIYKTRDRSLDLAIARKENLSDESIRLIQEMKGVKTGTDRVAGFPCDVWKVKDQEICLYMGIPLRITIDAPNFHSERKALQVMLNRPVPADQFQLPDLPVVVDEEYTSNASARTRTEDYIASVEDLQKKLASLGLDLNDPNATLTPEQERIVIDTLGERYLKKQKVLLPRLIDALGKAHSCIESANSPEEARNCLLPVNRINEKLGDRTEEFDFSRLDQDRSRILQSLEQELNYLKVTNRCVQEHNRTSEVIICTEGNLGEEEPATGVDQLKR